MRSTAPPSVRPRQTRARTVWLLKMLDQAREVGVAGHRDDLAVETDVVVDQGLDRDRRIDGVDLILQLGDLLICTERRREPGRLRLQHAPHREDLEHRIVVVHVDHERDRLQQQMRLEARHVGAVAATHVEDPDHLQRLDRFAHRAAGQAESFGQLLLGGKPITGGELARHDHRLDLLDRLVGDCHGVILAIDRMSPQDGAMRVLDSHLHLWDPEVLTYTWLEGPMAYRFADLELEHARLALAETGEVGLRAGGDDRRRLPRRGGLGRRPRPRARHRRDRRGHPPRQGDRHGRAPWRDSWPNPSSWACGTTCRGDRTDSRSRRRS